MFAGPVPLSGRQSAVEFPHAGVIALPVLPEAKPGSRMPTKPVWVSVSWAVYQMRPPSTATMKGVPELGGV